MTNSPNGSIFSPLDTSKPQIRLIHIEPRPPDNGEITCTLHLADLEDDSCRYEALSYEWGDASNTSFYIILNGQKFSVRENLWWALLNLRMKETVRIIWIDALCINQENEGERNHQVGNVSNLSLFAENSDNSSGLVSVNN
jgi:Heterokaryon incompatibility protein (HET)